MKFYCPITKDFIENCNECEMCPDEKDDSDVYREMKKESQARKENNLESSLKILREKGIAYKTLSPSHYRIGDFDFWPSTGKFYNRVLKKAGRGVFNLIRFLNK